MASLVGELKRQHGDIWLDLAEVNDGRHFVDAFLDTQPNRLDEGFRQVLFNHTGGHALFTVELLQEMQERGDLRQNEMGCWVTGETIDWQTLPPKIEGVIEQRINRLEDALRNVLTVASVEGESFTAEVVARIQALDGRQVVQRLSRELDKQYRLVTAEALVRLQQQRLSLYRFRHQLFQHYLYHQLDETERAYLHEEVGLALELLYGDEAERIAVQLAHHFAEAGIINKALDYLQKAGEQATRSSANAEAIQHLTKALDLLHTLPETSERARREFRLQLALSAPLMTTKSYGAPETVQAIDRASQLAEMLGDTREISPLLYGKWAAQYVRCKLQDAQKTATHFLSLAQQQPDIGPLLAGNRVLGSSLLFQGQIVSSRIYFEQGVSLYKPQQHRSLAFRFGQDPGASTQSQLGWCLWLLGYPDQAQEWCSQALRNASELNHINTLAYIIFFAGHYFSQLRRDVEAVALHVNATFAISKTHEIPLWLAAATLFKGWVLVEQGEADEGIAYIRQGIAGWQVTGSSVLVSHYLSVLIEAHLALRQTNEGLAAVSEALEFVERTDERWWEPEIYRLKGELLLKQSDADEAEASFQQAIDIARRQKSKLLELRATVSLARLWQSQGKRMGARLMLTEIYDWFTEGFDTVDLQEAKALLET